MTAPDGIIFYGDNGAYLKALPDASIDFIYADPPYNTNRAWIQDGREFVDSWDEAPRLRDLRAIEAISPPLAEFVRWVWSMRQDSTASYLAFMVPRLFDMHRLLTESGSLYVHCDLRASHYLKLILDTIFGADNFRSELIFRRNSGGIAEVRSKRWKTQHDTILYYAKSERHIWNRPYRPRTHEEELRMYRYVDDDGRRYKVNTISNITPVYDPMTDKRYKGQQPIKAFGVTAARVWGEHTLRKLEDQGRLLPPTKADGRPRYKMYLDEDQGLALGSLLDGIKFGGYGKKYPTAKPLKLLELLVRTSTNPGALVFDPFCGSGTTLAAAARLGRRWLGIDASEDAIEVAVERLRKLGYEAKVERDLPNGRSEVEDE